jgi:hypothetical protein
MLFDQAVFPQSKKKAKCEWQESNLRTPARIDLESITVGRLVTLAPGIPL